MKNNKKFNVTESEKNRIRNLHKNYSLIKEQSDVNVGVEPIGVDPAPPSDPLTPIEPFNPLDPGSGDNPILQADNGKTKSTTTTTQPSGIPCQTIYNALQSATGVPQYWQSPNVQQMIPAICSKCTSHYNSWVGAGSPNAPSGTGDWAQYGAQGQQICLMLIANPQCCTNTPPTMWGCSQTGSCVQDPNGQFQTQADCQSSGCGDVYCSDCIGGTMTLGTNGVCPQGYVQTPGTPGSTPPSPVCYECQSGVCNGPGWSSGQLSFNSQADCQNSQICQPSIDDYECVNGQCVIQAGGQYNSGPTSQDNLNACNSNCPPPPNMWECDNGPNGCTQTPNGTFNSQAQCETACCGDIINNYGWATNHPNATSTQACNRIYNQFGSIGSFNPNTLPFDDGCEYDWLVSIAGVCGVSQNYQNLITGFIGGNNGCYGNPNAQNQGYGQGNPHQNSACGKVEQFCEQPIGNVTPGTSSPTQWYKCQWTQQEAINGGCIC